MARNFHPGMNAIFRFGLLGAVSAVAMVLWAGGELSRSQYETREGMPREQTVPFSHQHHVGELGIDCRYCHTTVEVSKFAGIPSTSICMNCHSQMWASSSMLEPVRQSWRTDLSIAWTRVHDLPGFVYFDHSIHIAKGFGCSTCHGRVDRMALTWQHASLRMQWCLECHRNPEQYIRPKEEVFNIRYQPPPQQDQIGRRLVREYNVHSFTDCDTCHR